MDKSCDHCKYLEIKETKKNELDYGKCNKTGIFLLCIQMDCKYFKKDE